MPDPAVRVAAVEDAGAIAAIYAPYVRDTCVFFETEAPDADAMAGRIARTLATHPWLVAVQGGAVAGYAYAGRHRERAAYRWAVDVAVHVDGGRRRAGVGRVLHGALLPVLRRQGFRSAFAEIVLPNPGSVRLHEAMDFQHVGVHRVPGPRPGGGMASGVGGLGWGRATRQGSRCRSRTVQGRRGWMRRCGGNNLRRQPVPAACHRRAPGCLRPVTMPWQDAWALISALSRST